MIVISDTSPINNLAAIDQLHLLQQLYGTVFIPEAVYRELTDPSFPVDRLLCLTMLLLGITKHCRDIICRGEAFGR